MMVPMSHFQSSFLHINEENLITFDAQLDSRLHTREPKLCQTSESRVGENTDESRFLGPAIGLQHT